LKYMARLSKRASRELALLEQSIRPRIVARLEELEEEMFVSTLGVSYLRVRRCPLG